jgi:hypothetical protein
MKTNETVIPTDIYDADGNMTAIEFNDRNGKFVIESKWDKTDEQTSENRIKFREWTYRFLKQLGYKIAK